MIPGIAPNAGVIACGKLADIILVDENDLANVKRVIIGGKTIVHDGKLID
jgi:imidazolonepropionase-like amidohydrolase